MKKQEEWRGKYITYTVEQYGFSEAEANDVCEAGVGSHEYDDCPRSAVLEEMSYWGNWWWLDFWHEFWRVK